MSSHTKHLSNGIILVDCLLVDSGSYLKVPKRKCRGVNHEVCEKARSLEDSLILFKSGQFRPEYKVKVSRRLPRIIDYRRGRVIGAKRRVYKPNPVTVAKRAIAKMEKLQSEVLIYSGTSGNVERDVRRTATSLKLRQSVAIDPSHKRT